MMSDWSEVKRLRIALEELKSKIAEQAMLDYAEADEWEDIEDETFRSTEVLQIAKSVVSTMFKSY